ncbi:unnamed protein product [Ambrosiozyma monospora]|uniref:Unnamed protein product n=1 Tax=Ambrosiozyma monospora TaxID=43982 RepID=A0ACB5UCU8_AMBMO|nr:unnamed protein product [Ambrosiozyma monospora]
MKSSHLKWDGNRPTFPASYWCKPLNIPKFRKFSRFIFDSAFKILKANVNMIKFNKAQHQIPQVNIIKVILPQYYCQIDQSYLSQYTVTK